MSVSIYARGTRVLRHPSPSVCDSELLQTNGIPPADFAALDYRGINPNVSLVMLGYCAQNTDVPRQIILRERRHHAPGARTSNAQANGIPDREHFSDPSVLDEAFLAVLGLHNNIGPESTRLKAPLRIHLPEPIKRRRGQHMNGGGVEECSLRQRKVCDSVSMLQAFYIRPILLGLGGRPGGARERCCVECHLARERAR